MSTEKAPIRKERTAARIWTEEEKDIVWGEGYAGQGKTSCRSPKPSGR